MVLRGDVVPAEPAAAVQRRRLDEAELAHEDPRPLFDPKGGWFRRFERRVSNTLATKVFPRLRAVSGLYAAQLDSGLVVSETDAELPSLSPALDGLRLLFISDIHAGPFVSAGTLARTFRRLLATGPDVILLGGDLVTATCEEFTQHEFARWLDTVPANIPRSPWRVPRNTMRQAGPQALGPIWCR